MFSCRTIGRAIKFLRVHFVTARPQALAVQAHPRNAPHSTRLLCSLVDDIWRAAGDASTDYNWYTKRALLAGVYTSTELYMITDGSPGFADTNAALDRRIEEVMTIGKSIASILGVQKTAASSNSKI